MGDYRAVSELLKKKDTTASKRQRPVILLVGNEGGGIASLMGSILKHFEENCLPEVLFLGEGRMSSRIRKQGIQATYLGRSEPKKIHGSGKFSGLRSMIAYGYNSFWLLLRAWRLGRYLRQRGNSILHVNMTYPAIIALMVKPMVNIRIVCHWHVIGNGACFKPLLWLLGKYTRLFVAISRSVKESLPDTWQKKTVIIYNAVDVGVLADRARDSKGELRTIVGVDSSTTLVVNLATFSPHKGQHFLVEAMRRVTKEIKDIRCIFLGRTPSKESENYVRELKRLAIQMGVVDKCDFLINLPQPSSLLADADLMAIMTWGLGEGFGLVAAEAMACGVPVVAFEAGGVSEIIEHGKTGLLVSNEDSDAFGNEIVKIIRDPRKAKSLSNTAKIHVKKHFDIMRLSLEMSKVYEEVSRMSKDMPEKEREASR